MHWLKMAGGGSFALFAVLAAVIGISKDGLSPVTVVAGVFFAGCAYAGARVALDGARHPRAHKAKLLEQLDKSDPVAAGDAAPDADARRRAAAAQQRDRN